MEDKIPIEDIDDRKLLHILLTYSTKLNDKESDLNKKGGEKRAEAVEYFNKVKQEIFKRMEDKN